MKTGIEKTGEIIGVFLYSLTMIIPVLLFGKEFDDVLFDKVITIVEISLFFRRIHVLLLYGSLLIIASLVLILKYKPVQGFHESHYWTGLITRIIAGWLLANWVIYSMINGIFYRNAIVTFPFLLGSLLLLTTLLGIRYDFKLNEIINEWRSEDTIFKRRDLIRGMRVVRYFGLGILSLLIILPTIGPLSGFQPEPPGVPPIYGGVDGPYDVTKIRLNHQVPSNISDYLIPDNNNASWYIFVYLPNTNNMTIPLTFYAHGYTGTNPADYENSLFQLASRGNAVIFVQYVTDVELTGEFTEPEETNFTRSNAMYIRYLMEWNGILQAVNTLTVGQNNEVNEVLQGSIITTEYIQIIGHSVGGGMIPYLATKTVENGWGNKQLILDLETPWFASEHPQLQYNLSILPETTIVNIVGSQDDHSASPCIGMRHYERFVTDLQIENLDYLIIPSDYHGFPRLVATHYLVTSTLDDTLTKWGYLKRVDGMVAYLVALANNQDSTGITQYFRGGGDDMISQGVWSDGEPVNQLIHSKDPFGIRGGENLAENYINSHDVGPEICVI